MVERDGDLKICHCTCMQSRLIRSKQHGFQSEMIERGVVVSVECGSHTLFDDDSTGQPNFSLVLCREGCYVPIELH